VPDGVVFRAAELVDAGRREVSCALDVDDWPVYEAMMGASAGHCPPSLFAPSASSSTCRVVRAEAEGARSLVQKQAELKIAVTRLPTYTTVEEALCAWESVARIHATPLA
jgi:hypothetical protein